MKILVCGSSGLVGNDLCSLFDKEIINYVGIHNTRPQKNSYKIDILNPIELAFFFDKHQPTVCVNCIADRNVDLCETNWEQTKKVNIDIVAALAKECAKRHIFFLQISTDYVFDGRDSPYTPKSQLNPLQNYGMSKMIAECRVKTYLQEYCIVRVPVLYTNTYHYLSETAVTVLAKKVMNQIEAVKEDNYSIRRPVFIPDFCRFLLSCILTKKTGIYHFYNEKDKTTKYEMCKIIGEFLQKPVTHIEPVNTPPSNDAGRPYDTNFTDSQYNIQNFTSMPIAGGISICLDDFWHPSLDHSQMAEDYVFLLFDLDGTLVDTDKLHYECYQKVFADANISLDWSTYSQFQNIDEGLQAIVNDKELFLELKQKKRILIQKTASFDMIHGAKELIEHLVTYNIGFAVVTNTGKETVDHFKSICPTLQLIKNWIVREDYTNPKPDPECFKLAMQRYYKNQKYIIGIENNLTGFKSLQSITSRIYIVTKKENSDYNTLKKEDCYLINDLTRL